MFFALVRQYEGGVVLRLGKFHRMAHPGFCWIWPLMIEEVITTSVVVETMIVGPQSLKTKDGQLVVISTVITFEITDPKIFLLEIQGASRVIEDSTYGVVSEWVSLHTWEELLDPDLGGKLSRAVRALAKKYGVNIIRVQIADFTKSRSLRLMQSVTQSYAPTKEF